MHVGIVACGDRAPEAIISLKSFAMLSSKPLHFHVFAEDTLHKEFEKAIQEWPGFIEGRIKLDIQSIQYPVDGDFNEWKKLFKPCASQRLFFPVRNVSDRSHNFALKNRNLNISKIVIKETKDNGRILGITLENEESSIDMF